MTSTAWRRSIPLALGIAVAAGLALWLAREVDLRELKRLLLNVRPWPLVLLAALPIFSSTARALRLHLVLQRKAGFVPCLHATNIGIMVNCLLPLRSGEICMAMLLGPRLPGGRTEALSRLFIDRLLDTLAVLAIFAASLPLVDQAQAGVLDSSHALWLIGAVAVMIVAATWIFCAQEPLVLRSVQTLARLLHCSADPWEQRAKAALDGLRALFQGHVFFVAGGLSVVAWGLVALTFHTSVAALFPPPPAACSMLAVSLIVLGLVIAPMPAGISTTHGAIVLAMGIFGVAPERALSVAILYHTVTTAVSLLMGGIGLWTTGMSFERLLNWTREGSAAGTPDSP